MKLKITSILLGLFCLLLNSCRETEDLNDSAPVSDKSVILKSSSMNKESDTTANHKDPPIKGTHWKPGS